MLFIAVIVEIRCRVSFVLRDPLGRHLFGGMFFEYSVVVLCHLRTVEESLVMQAFWSRRVGFLLILGLCMDHTYHGSRLEKHSANNI